MKLATHWPPPFAFGTFRRLIHGLLGLQVSRLAPQDVGFVSVHGTGTPLGDPIEAGALGQALAVPRGDATHVTLGVLLCDCQPAICTIFMGNDVCRRWPDVNCD
jgi:Beta-ketoacyl synthase, C-terminal domain